MRANPKRDGAHQPSRRKHEGVPPKSWRRKELKALPKCPNACLDTPLRAKEEVTETKVSGNQTQEGTQAHQKGRIQPYIYSPQPLRAPNEQEERSMQKGHSRHKSGPATLYKKAHSGKQRPSVSNHNTP